MMIKFDFGCFFSHKWGEWKDEEGMERILWFGYQPIMIQVRICKKCNYKEMK